MGIRLKSLIIIGVLSFLSIIASGVASYKFSVQNATYEAKSKGQIVLNYIHSSRKYLKNVQRPLTMELVEKDRFYPELMSGFFVARGVYEIFETKLPDYKFKQATLDPLHQANKADADEIDIITTFRDNADLEMQEGTIKKDNQEYFYLAQPIKISDKKCLKCHGDPADAPKDQLRIYGSENGYNWEMGDTVAAFIVYVPLKKALDAAMKSTQSLLVIGSGCIILALLVIWFFLDRSVVAPIIQLSDRAKEISLGKNIGESINTKAVGEVGILARAIERMRISIITIIKRSQKQLKKRPKNG